MPSPKSFPPPLPPLLCRQARQLSTSLLHLSQHSSTIGNLMSDSNAKLDGAAAKRAKLDDEATAPEPGPEPGPKPAPPSDVGGPTTTAAERAEAAAMRHGGGAAAEPGASPPAASPTTFVDTLPSVFVPEGTWKYVLIRAEGVDGPKHLVRGRRGAAYHMDAASPTVQALEEHGCTFEVLGGGRIRHDTDEKTILIYGHSYGFPWNGPSLHHISRDLCSAAFPAYKSVDWTDEGY